jgi:hypothetical protein
MAKFFFSKSYLETLERIENYIFSTNNSIELINSFLDELDHTLNFIMQNPNTAQRRKPLLKARLDLGVSRRRPVSTSRG